MKKWLKRLLASHEKTVNRMDAIVDAAEAEDRDLTDDEDVEVDELREKAQRQRERITEVRDEIASEAEADEARSELEDIVRPTEEVRVKSEETTYRQGDPRVSYLQDLCKVEYDKNPRALARLTRHGREMEVEWEKRSRDDAHDFGASLAAFGPEASETRDLDRTDGTGGYFVPPLWMVDEFVDLARAGRITANLVQQRPLPAGTDSINVPKVSTGTATAIQTADNASVAETDLADTSVNAPVRTVAGQQDLAQQLIDQSPIAFDDVVFADLTADYASKVDVQVINGSGSSGQVTGLLNVGSINAVTYTDASPTVPEIYPKVADGIQQIDTGRLMPAQVHVLHPRRTGWINAALDSSNRPLVVPSAQGPQNAFARAGEQIAEGLQGELQGLPMYKDPNVPITLGGGTEDRVITFRPDDCWLWESAIRMRTLTEVLSGTLTVRLQVYGYIAFLGSRRPEGISVISGTGVVTPTF